MFTDYSQAKPYLISGATAIATDRIETVAGDLEVWLTTESGQQLRLTPEGARGVAAALLRAAKGQEIRSMPAADIADGEADFDPTGFPWAVEIGDLQPVVYPTVVEGPCCEHDLPQSSFCWDCYQRFATGGVLHAAWCEEAGCLGQCCDLAAVGD